MLSRWQHTAWLATTQVPQHRAAIEAARDATGHRSERHGRGVTWRMGSQDLEARG